MKLLIADDSEVFVHRLESTLAEVTGIEIVGYANNVPDALQEIRKEQPDVVILGLGLQGGSSIDVLEALKEDQFKTIVIVLSNCSFPQYRKKCLRSGARFFFDKSTEFEKVAEVLRTLLRRGAV
jgi:DNA-binding NarL/FixJ family response regulator